MLQIMLGGVADAASTIEPDLWRRYLGLILVGMRAEGSTPSPPHRSTGTRWTSVLNCWRPPRRD